MPDYDDYDDYDYDDDDDDDGLCEHGRYPDYECEDCNRPHYDVAWRDHGDWTSIPGPSPGRQRHRTAFGIEIEFNRNVSYEIVDMMVSSGIECRSGYCEDGEWGMGADPTVTGGELRSPIMTGSDRSIDEVMRTLRIVSNAGATTDAEVGMHVHLDVRMFNIAQLRVFARNLRAAEEYLYRFCGDDRLGGYSARLNSDDWQDLFVELGEHRGSDPASGFSSPLDRYVAFNFACHRHGTVEVRALGSTFAPHRVRAWIRVLLALHAAARRRTTMPTGASLDWLREWGLDDASIEVFYNVTGMRPVTRPELVTA